MTKRDNLALCIFPITLCFIAFIRKSENLKPQVCNVLLVAVTVIVYHLFYSNVINTEQVEAVAINQPTFSLQYFKILFPKFIVSLFSIQNFGVIAYTFVFVLVLSAVRKKIPENYSIGLLVLLFLYVVMYSAHYRGYYFVVDGDVSVFETFRYINNFYILIVLYIVLNMDNLPSKLTYTIAVYTSIVCIATFCLRREYHKIEQERRFDSAQTIVSYLSNQEYNFALVTDMPLIYQSISDDDFCICDITQCGNFTINNESKLFCHITNLDNWKERYGVTLKEYTLVPIIEFENGELLVELQ